MCVVSFEFPVCDDLPDIPTSLVSEFLGLDFERDGFIYNGCEYVVNVVDVFINCVQANEDAVKLEKASFPFVLCEQDVESSLR